MLFHDFCIICTLIFQMIRVWIIVSSDLPYFIIIVYCTENTAPTNEEILSLRAFLLLLVKQLVLKVSSQLTPIIVHSKYLSVSDWVKSNG